MTKLTENTIENFAIELLKKLGYDYFYAPDIAPDGEKPERTSYEDVLLVERLQNAIRRINPNIPIDSQKKTLKEYGRWSKLSTYVEGIETHIDIDFRHSLENAKALLESVGKQICIDNEVDLGATPGINTVLKKAFISLGYANSNLANKVLSTLATIGQQVGELRNSIGLASHGKSLEELNQRNNKEDVLTREFLIDTVELVSVFLIINFETKVGRTSSERLEDTLDYREEEEFNESWDDLFGGFTMGDYSYPASEILFNVDKQAYINEYKAFIESEE